MALKNGIKNENYIIIDARDTSLSSLKKQIMNSGLLKFIDFNKLNWEKCYENSLKSSMIEACNLWNTGKYTVKQISKIINVSRRTASIYLEKCNEAGLCIYDADVARIKSRYKKVICITTKEIFNSLKEAQDKYGLKDISRCCKGKTHYCGIHPITGEKLKWIYYEDYLKLQN